MGQFEHGEVGMRDERCASETRGWRFRQPVLLALAFIPQESPDLKRDFWRNRDLSRQGPTSAVIGNSDG